jgi:hypothetical protein
VRPGRVLFGGLALVYLLAYLRGAALLVAMAATVGLLVWRSRATGGRPISAAASRRAGWAVDDTRVAATPLAGEGSHRGGWPTGPVMVRGVPEPRAAVQPAGFAALVELGDHAGRQATLQLEAAYPVEVDLEGLLRQALTQAGRRAGWRVERWQPVSDAAVAPDGWDQAGGLRR